MKYITSLVRMWLTRSAKPFLFQSEYDQTLPFSDCESLGLYVHIPFCRQICSFCPYCKELYREEKCNHYLDDLLEEIRLVTKDMEGKKKVTGLYFGGGSPALAAHRLKEIIDFLSRKFIITEGIGVELHPNDISEETLFLLKESGVTKLSIGIQSFQPKFLSLLGRSPLPLQKMSELLSKYEFETVSTDFIFALPGQTIEDLIADIETAFSIGADHIAVYPFIDFSFSDHKVDEMPKNEKRRLLAQLTSYFDQKGCKRNSIWTFSNNETSNYSSMTRENFLGFGCSATTLIQKQFKINTFSVEEYGRRVRSGNLPTSLTLRFSERQRMIYYLFWTLYSTKIRAADFETFFGKSLSSMYGLECFLARKLGYLSQEGDEWKMTEKGAFFYHYYENFYTLAYIDKMWGIMKEEAFPSKIEL